MGGPLSAYPGASRLFGGRWRRGNRPAYGSVDTEFIKIRNFTGERWMIRQDLVFSWVPLNAPDAEICAEVRRPDRLRARVPEGDLFGFWAHRFDEFAVAGRKFP